MKSKKLLNKILLKETKDLSETLEFVKDKLTSLQNDYFILREKKFNLEKENKQLKQELSDLKNKQNNV